MTIMAIGVLSHWTQANSFEFVVRQNHGRPQSRGESRRALRRSFPLKPTN